MIQLFPYKCSAFIDLHYYLLKSYFAPCIVPAVGGWSDKQNKQTSCLHETFTWEQMGSKYRELVIRGTRKNTLPYTVFQWEPGHSGLPHWEHHLWIKDLKGWPCDYLRGLQSEGRAHASDLREEHIRQALGRARIPIWLDWGTGVNKVGKGDGAGGNII